MGCSSASPPRPKIKGQLVLPASHNQVPFEMASIHCTLRTMSDGGAATIVRRTFCGRSWGKSPRGKRAKAPRSDPFEATHPGDLQETVAATFSLADTAKFQCDPHVNLFSSQPCAWTPFSHTPPRNLENGQLLTGTCCMARDTLAWAIYANGFEVKRRGFTTETLSLNCLFCFSAVASEQQQRRTCIDDTPRIGILHQCKYKPLARNGAVLS